VGGKCFVWDGQDIIRLRTEYRIVGTLVGSLPSFSQQNQFHSRPLLLCDEEATLLLARGVVKLIDDTVLYEPTEEEAQAFKREREEDFIKQLNIGIEEKKRKAAEWTGKGGTQKKEKKGKKGKVSEATTLDNENTKSMDLSNNNSSSNSSNDASTTQQGQLQQTKQPQKPQVFDPTITIHTKTNSNNTTRPEQELLTWQYPKTPEEKRRFRVYEDLHNKGMYVTNASKFGGDYLVYLGDPLRFHAQFVVSVVAPDHPISPLDIVAFSRLGVSVKKSSVLAVAHEDGKVEYMTIDWQGVT